MGHEPNNLPPAIDTEVLFRRSMGKIAFAMALLDELEATGNHHVETIQTLAANDDAEATAEAAHSLKGAAAIIGAESLRSLAAEIEAVAETDDLERAASLIEDLRGEMARCLTQIPEIRGPATVQSV